MNYQIGDWFIYNISQNGNSGELCQIVDVISTCYTLKLYTHGYCFPGVTIVKEEFARCATPISDEHAMILKLSLEN